MSVESSRDSRHRPQQRDRTLSDAGHSASILTINGGSSSIKFAIYTLAEPPRQRLRGAIDRIGVAGTSLEVVDADGRQIERQTMDASSHEHAAQHLIAWLHGRTDVTVSGVGHRVVHGGFHLLEHQPITDELVARLRRAQGLDLAHLPREIALIEAFRRSFPAVLHIACLDTAFHRDMPGVAKLLPIPRHYQEAGLRRLGFHGLSYSYLMQELERVAGAEAAAGRIILAHLGAGASMAAVRQGRTLDTTMGLTPTAGLVMARRPGDLDPGLLVYLQRSGNMSPEQTDDFINRRCGLAGVSATTSDMHDLLERRTSDPRAADAVSLFCYQARKWIGAYAAVLGGLDTLVFAGGIGEHAAPVREEICEPLGFLGIRLDAARNAKGAPIISSDNASVTVRVMHTDEESVIARSVRRFLLLNEAESRAAPR
jgi:acetate kinase